MGLVAILIWLLVLGLFCYILSLILALFPIPVTVQRIILLIIGLIALIYILQRLGLVAGMNFGL